MRVLALSTLLAPTLLALCSCSSREPPGPGGDPSPEGRERAVSVWMQLAAEGITDDVRALTARHHGYVQRGVEHERSASLELRVPAAELEALRRELRGLGELGYEREEIADVTDEHSDLNARLRNARREEERLLALMEERTHSLADVLAVEARLSAVRERIEQLEATERALGRRVEMAVVHVEIAPAIVPFWQRPGETIADAGSWGVSAAQAVVVGTAAAIAALGPLALLGLLAIALLVLATRWLARRPAPARP